MKARQRKARKGMALRLFHTECFLRSPRKQPQKQNSTPSILDLERALTHSYKKIMVCINWKDVLLVVEVLPWLSPAKETIQFGILIFLETQEMNLQGNLKDSKCDILHIFMGTFFVLRKGSFPLLTLYFLSKHFYARSRWYFPKLTLFL